MTANTSKISMRARVGEGVQMPFVTVSVYVRACMLATVGLQLRRKSPSACADAYENVKKELCCMRHHDTPSSVAFQGTAGTLTEPLTR